MSKQPTDKISLPFHDNATDDEYLKTNGACPACLHTENTESTESSNELYMTRYGPRSYDYTLLTCGYCGCRWKEIVGPLAIIIINPADINLE